MKLLDSMSALRLTKQTKVLVLGGSLCISTVGGFAQINAGKLKDAVKKEVPSKEKVKGQAETDLKKKAESEVEKQQEQANEPKTPRNPSAEAIAKDPAASDKKVKEGYTKSPAEIRAAYEALDPEIYFQPYYHPFLRNWYLLDDKSDKQFLEDVMTVDKHYRTNTDRQMTFTEKKSEGNVKTRIFGGGFRAQYYHFRQETIPAGNTDFRIYDDLSCYMPIGISAAYAGYALFAADPQGFIPFLRLCEARNAAFSYDAGVWSGLDAPNMARDATKVKLNAKGEVGTLPMEEHQLTKPIIMGGNMEQSTRKLAGTVTPIAVIQKAAEHYLSEIQKYEAQNSYGMMRYNLHVLEHVIYLWYMHDKWEGDAAAYKRVVGEFDKYVSRYKQWKEQELLSSPSVAMPKTYDMGAALAEKALAQAKKQMAGSFNADKVVFLSDTWNEFKEKDYPYRVMHRSIDAAILTNDNGKWSMRRYSFIQDSDTKGGWKESYSFQAGASVVPERVDYKP